MQRWALSAAAAAALAGCAVMTIDVDVYKGPLANHADVQIEQMAAMAVGARPLLVRLKCDLLKRLSVATEPGKCELKEGLDTERPYGVLGLRRLSPSNLRMAKLVGIGAATIDPGMLAQKSDQIELIQVIESIERLYFDRSKNDPIARFTTLLNQGVEASERATRQAAILAIRGPTIEFGKKPTALQKELLEMRETLVKKQKTLVEKLEGVKKRRSELADLANSYAKFIDPGPRSFHRCIATSGRTTFRNWNRIIQTLKHIDNTDGLRTKLLAGHDLETLPERCAYDPKAMTDQQCVPVGKPPRKCGAERFAYSSSNGAYYLLSNEIFLRAHAEQFFFLESDRELFVTEVRRIAMSFIRTREAIAELLRAGLKGLALSDELDIGLSKDKAIGDVAGFTAKLIDPQHLRLALQLQKSKSYSIMKLRDKLMKKLPKPLKSNFDDLDQWKNKGQMVQEKLAEFLTSHPVFMARTLLDADKYLIKEFVQSARTPSLTWLKDAKYQQKFGQPVRLQFGLSAGPVHVLKLMESVGDFAGDFRGKVEPLIGQASQFSLDRGRLEPGLYTLIENYLRAASKRHVLSEKEQEIAERQLHILIDALVRFAEKVLFLANHERLLDLLRDTSDKETDRRIQTFVQILQAVGNSVLVQADELSTREWHGMRLTRARDREVNAINNAYGGGRSRAFDHLLGTVRGRLSAIRTEADKIAVRLTKIAEELKAPRKKRINTQNDCRKALRLGSSADCDLPKGYKVLLEKLAAAHETMTGDADVTGKIGNLSKPATPPPYDAKKDFDRILQELRTAKNEETIKLAKDRQTGRKERLAKAVEVFEGNIQLDGKDLKTIVTGPTLPDRDKLVATIKNTLLAFRAKETERARGWEKAVAAFKKADDEVEKLNERQKAAQAEQKTKGDKKIKLEHAESAMTALRGQVTAAVGKDDTRPVGEAVYEELLKALQEGLGKKPKNKNLQNALTVVSGLSAPMAVPTGFDARTKNAKEVLDGLIAALRHRHIEALERGGEAAGANKELALVEAYRQRAGMIYIRPAMAYLRSSFAATTLQRDPGIGWENMLSKHARRSIPLFGGALNRREKDELKIKSEIDKQFWHNINSVRVAGAGRTNYAIVKDDIGNWYVKAYSSDPQDIIKSARNLALFGMGSGLDTDLLGRVTRREAGGQEEAELDANRTTLGRVFVKYRDQYDAATTEHRRKLLESLAETGLREDIRKAWSDDDETKGFIAKLGNKLNADYPAVTRARTELARDNDKDGNQFTPPQLAMRMVTALHAIKVFHSVLNKNIYGLLTGGPAKELQAAEAVKADRDKTLKAEQAKLREVEKANPPVKQDDGTTKEDPEVTKQKEAVSKAGKESKAAADDVKKKMTALATAKRAEKVAVGKLTDGVKATLTTFIGHRQEAVTAFETSVVFIGDATKTPAKKNDTGAAPPAATEVPTPQ